ncbi:hypothetical protein LCM02_11570 [Lutimonas saemankumensis]|uniref:hypothetical protein n=1 Tax=Lutimonas saemankumensis TaxID=483016 RepID=UPI001CD62E54|nr:hypothetical protein [Lutimonas saemankumensis]MCA0933094.1 hypothetical protein [Lutimonas saemankumensis]
MGSIHQRDENLFKYFDLNDQIIKDLVFKFKHYYENGELSIGIRHSENFFERETMYTVVDSEFENLFLHLKYKNVEFGNPFEIHMIINHSDSPTEIKITLDEFWQHKLPEEMLKNLRNKLFDIDSPN